MQTWQKLFVYLAPILVGKYADLDPMVTDYNLEDPFLSAVLDDGSTFIIWGDDHNKQVRLLWKRIDSEGKVLPL